MNERYKRQVSLIGEEGQKKLKNSAVLIIGAGGLGNIAAKFLASSGIGDITIVDSDIVEKSNLNRQLLFNDESIGKSKAKSLEKTLNKINPDISCFGVYSKFTAKSDIKGFDIVLDCTDTMESSYIIEKKCLELGIPLVFAKTSRYYGIVTVLRDTPYLKKNYPSKQLNRDNAVFPPIGGMIGSMQAGFAMKLLLGLKVDDEIVQYDFINNETTKYKKGGK